MRCYSHLSDDEREQIGLAKAVGHSIGAIAKAIGRPKSTVSRELLRNGLPSGRYSPLHAAGAYQLRSGEAGIGKSRLTAALLERLTSEPHTRLRYFCSPQHTDSAFYPIISQMERAAGITHDDALPTKLDKLDAMLAQSSTSAHDAALFAEMLSLLNDGRYPPLDSDPHRRRQRTLEALTTTGGRNSRAHLSARLHPCARLFQLVGSVAVALPGWSWQAAISHLCWACSYLRNGRPRDFG